MEAKPSARVFTLGRSFSPHMVPNDEREIHQLDVLLIGENENLASAKGVITGLVPVALQEFANVSIIPTKLGFVGPSGIVQMQCRLCEGRGCSTCRNKGVVAIGLIGTVRSKMWDMLSLDSEHNLASYVGLNIDVLAMQHFLIPHQDSLYGPLSN
jgi:phenylalanyl-tRNA synthetase alpha chain